MPTQAKKTAEKGLGWRHRQAVEELRRRHKDGTPCEWCGRPMYLDRTLNFDYDPDKRLSGVLHGDHSVQSRSEAIRRGLPVLPPDRLLHGECNRQRGAGTNDHLAAMNRGTVTEELSMEWPW